MLNPLRNSIHRYGEIAKPMTTLQYTPPKPKTIGETRNNSSPLALLGQPGPDLGVFLSLPLSFLSHIRTVQKLFSLFCFLRRHSSSQNTASHLLRQCIMASSEILTEVLPDEILSMLKDTPKGMMIVPFTNVTDIKEIVRQQIRKVQNDESDDRLIFVTKFPFGPFMSDFSNFETYQRGVAASCKSMYFDGHELLIMKITQDVTMDTNNVTLSPEQLNGDGVEAYVLKKLEKEIELFRDETGLPKHSHWFRYGQSCHTSGEYGEEGRVPSRRQCELMLMPSHNLKDIRDSNDFQHEDWPCVVFETGPARSNDACREYLWFAADWWFQQSRGMVKVVFLLFFDRKNRRLDIEKVVYSKELLC
jgi:hypothetical protein